MKNKKIAALMLVTALTASMFTGCGASEQKQESAVQSSEKESNAAEAVVSTVVEEESKGYDGMDNLQVSEEPVTVTMHYTFGGNGAPTGDTPIWQEIAKITNVSMENVANPSISDEGQAINTMLASGELPDIITANATNMSSVVSQGALIPLDDLIAEYAPNIQKFLEDYPEAVASGTGADGQIYLLSGTLGGEAGQTLPSMGLFIRMDWIEKLNLEVPTTLEEFEEVLYAFRNDDPNGNGIQDEIPYFYRDKGIHTLYQFWNAYRNFYIDGDDGKVHYGQAEEEYKNALTDLTRWYADGIIDPEIFTRGSQARQELLGNDIGGCTIDWFASTGQMNDTLKETVPDMDFAAIAPPADVNGVVKLNQGRSALHSVKIGISVNCEDPVTVIKFLDFCYTQTGSRLLRCGIEGTDYTVEDGKIQVTEYAMNAHSAGYPNYLRTIGGYEFAAYGNLESEKSSMNKWAREGFELYENSDWVQEQFPSLSFTEEEQKVIDNCYVNITTMVDEYEQSVLLGSTDLNSTWEKHLEELNAVGLQELLAAYNSAYERYLATIE